MYSHFGRVMEDGRLSQIIIGFANEDLDIRRNNIDMFNNALPSNVVKRKVLIVEDNEINREILKETLEDDYDVFGEGFRKACLQYGIITWKHKI